MTTQLPNPNDTPVFVPDESPPTIAKVHRKFQTGLESVRAQLKRHDVVQQEQKAKLMQALARPENSGLELTDVAYKYIDTTEAYELTLLLIKEYLEGYLEEAEESSEISTYREQTQKSASRMLKEIDRLRRENNFLYTQYHEQQAEIAKSEHRAPETGEPAPKTYEVLEEAENEENKPS